MFSTSFKRTLLVIVVLLTSVLVLSACGGGGEDTGDDGGGDDGGDAEAEPIKVGAIFDLSGATADVGTPYADGVRAYVAYTNDNGGIDGHQIDLISADYAYVVDQAEQLYTQYVTQDNVVVFQGWGTGDTEALRGRIAEDEVPFMSASYSATLADPNEAPYNFMIGTTYSDQFIIAIQWAIENSSDGAPTIALMHHDSPFGLSPLEDGMAYAEANGAEVIDVPMPGGATDYTAELTRVEDAGAEFIVIQNVSSPAATLVKDVQRLGVEAQVICLNWCTDELFASLAGDAANGVIGASPFAFPGSDAEGLGVIEDYMEEHGAEQSVHFVQGWTTMSVMAEGIRRVLEAGDEVTGPNVRAALEGISDFSTGGITADITFSASNHAGNKALRLWVVEDGAWTAMTDYIEAP